MKINVQRLVKVWVCDTYEVDEVTPEIIQDAINYNIDCQDSETFWETLIDLGSVEVYDDKNKLIYNIDE